MLGINVTIEPMKRNQNLFTCPRNYIDSTKSWTKLNDLFDSNTKIYSRIEYTKIIYLFLQFTRLFSRVYSFLIFFKGMNNPFVNKNIYSTFDV